MGIFYPRHGVEMRELIFPEHNKNKFIDEHMVYFFGDDSKHSAVLGRDFNTL